MESFLLYFIGRSFSHGRSHASISCFYQPWPFGLRLVASWIGQSPFYQAVRGFRRGAAVRDCRRAVSYEMLLRIGVLLCQQCFSDFEVALFRLAFSLAFVWVFRTSELVAPSRLRAGGLCYRDVQVMDSSLECLLRQSKMDQGGRGVRFLRGAAPGTLLILTRTLVSYPNINLCRFFTSVLG